MMNYRPVDYRAKLKIEMHSALGGWLGSDRISELLDGHAAQAVREDRERRENELARGVQPGAHQEILTAALTMRGFVPEAARTYVQEFADRISDGAHKSYRVLADAVTQLIGETGDPDDWDGDDPEASILCRFLEWLPDLIAHQVCDKIRSQVVGGQYAADWADPFVFVAGEWLRKSDGARIPGKVAKP
jgi:hypothetical protein